MASIIREMEKNKKFIFFNILLGTCRHCTLMAGDKKRCLRKGRHTYMSRTRKERCYNEEYLQNRFDHFAKKVIKNQIRMVLRSYTRNMKRKKMALALYRDGLKEDTEVPQIEKIQVNLGNTLLYFEDERLAEAIGTLGEKYQKVLEYAFVFDLPPDAAAKLLKIKKRSAIQYKRNALSILKKYMEEPGDEEQEKKDGS